MLSDGAKDGLMVFASVDARHSVGTRRQSTSNIGTQHTINGSVVEALEEREDVGVGDRRRGYRGQLFDDNMGVTNDITSGVHGARSSEVVRVGVHEVSGVHVLNVHFDGEVGVRFDNLTIDGGLELGRRKVR